jgi:hypothetical protein
MLQLYEFFAKIEKAMIAGIGGSARIYCSQLRTY